MADLPTTRWSEGGKTAQAGTPAVANGPRQDQGDSTSDHVSRFAALALLLLAMFLWLFTALLFAHHGYYIHHQYPGPYPGTGWPGGWQRP
jgi:hypothetical protein